MFFLLNETEFTSYADGNTPYVAFDNVDDDSVRLFKWFSGKQKANKNK